MWASPGLLQAALEPGVRLKGSPDYQILHVPRDTKKLVAFRALHGLLVGLTRVFVSHYLIAVDSAIPLENIHIAGDIATYIDLNPWHGWLDIHDMPRPTIETQLVDAVFHLSEIAPATGLANRFFCHVRFSLKWIELENSQIYHKYPI